MSRSTLLLGVNNVNNDHLDELSLILDSTAFSENCISTAYFAKTNCNGLHGFYLKTYVIDTIVDFNLQQVPVSLWFLILNKLDYSYSGKIIKI